MNKVIVVSGDSHAVMPPERWAEYVEAEYQQHLPAALADHEDSREMRNALNTFTPEALSVMDREGAWSSGGYLGAWDRERRIAEMDREGIAAELFNEADPRAHTLFAHWRARYPQDVMAAGRRAYHRFVADEFAPSRDRLLGISDVGEEVDVPRMVAQLEWCADNGFIATRVPGHDGRKDIPPLSDELFDPYWAKCAELGTAAVLHAGFGGDAGSTIYDGLKASMQAAGRTNLIEEILFHAGAIFELDLKPRQAMWQMMFGGVFDRHPNLRLALLELRGDWLPATLRHLDAAWEAARDDVPAKRRPSDYWASNCLGVLSFMHKAEAEIRHDIGIETVAFGRDFPHSEGTWPNTREWISDLFVGVPDDEVRLMLGENSIRFFGLDLAHLQTIANRVGPTIDEVTGREVDPRLVQVFNSRGGYLKPVEQIDRDGIDALLGDDIAYAVARK